MERTDEELLELFGAGVEEAFNQLFDRHKGKIFNFALRLLVSRADAEDVTSETFIQLFNKRYRPTDRAKMTTWLFTVARNACLSRLRARKFLQPLWFRKNDADGFEEWDLPDTADTPGETLRKKETAKAVKQAIETLPQEQKEAIILREYGGQDYAAIADILGCSIEKVKILIFRGRENLRIALAAFIKEGTQ